MHTESVEQLIAEYSPLNPGERVDLLFNRFSVEEVLITSSFSIFSVYLLSILSNSRKDLDIHFIDTGFHFPETLDYLDTLAGFFNFKVRIVRPLASDHLVTSEGKIWEKDPDRCCYLNKVKPVRELCGKYRLWISGLMQWQTDYRETLRLFEQREDILRFYPILDVPEDLAVSFLKDGRFPEHPLGKKGFSSIGCINCTELSSDRSGRWKNFSKSECGIHL